MEENKTERTEEAVETPEKAAPVCCENEENFEKGAPVCLETEGEAAQAPARTNATASPPAPETVEPANAPANAPAPAGDAPANDGSAPAGDAPAKEPASESLPKKKGVRAALARIDWPYTVGTVALTLVFLVFYLFGVQQGWQWTFWTCFVLFWGSVVAYIGVNRGISRTRVSREMLPPGWSEQEKEEYITTVDRWRRHSKPILLLVIPLGLTFLYDTIDIFFGDVIRDVLRVIGIF